ncbi:TPA: sugar ABC transporter ATP-binding protein [Candidatus Poribacteria bacterium]|nr:sugar ABC transporter ATP-binding protein [Candidatus Poribacteria bacterium]
MQDRLLVEMKNITKHFGGVVALKEVDFQVGYQEIVGLVGDNGAGKSTLIKILAGVHNADKGEIFFEGRKVEIRNPMDAKNLGIETVFQELALVDNLDVTENIFLGRELTKFGLVDHKRMEYEAQRLLNELKIEIDSVRTRVRNLSGGQRQGVALSRAFYVVPKLVLMDEPIAALAVKEVNKVLNLVDQLRERGISIVFISHNLQAVLSIADRIVVLRKGRKAGDRRAEEVSLDEIIRLMIGEEEELIEEEVSG